MFQFELGIKPTPLTKWEGCKSRLQNEMSAIPTALMLRLQIKLTLYDFSDLHITGEFDNRPGTGIFFRMFSCVVTYHMGAGRRLFMETSADARPGTVKCCMAPGRRCKRFNTNFHAQLWKHLYQNLSSFLQRNWLLK